MLINRPEGGFYVGFEGLSGVGKTYFLNELRSEPGIHTISELPDSGLGMEILRALRASDDAFFRHGYPTIEGLLFYGMKVYEIREEVVPYLQAGKTVLQDRAFYSTIIYSAILKNRRNSDRSIGEYFEEFESVRSQLTFRPDLNVYLYDDFDACLQRAQNRNGRKYAQDEVQILRSMHDFYGKLVGEYPEEMIRVDTRGKSNEQVVDEMLRIIEEHE